mgnify:CR=1 FL=1
MRTEPRFVKPSDYLNYIGRDLNFELKANQNESNKANLFLMQIEDMLLARIDKTSFRLYSWDCITEYQKDCLQKAIIIEANYIIRNSNLFTDSGYDPDRGEIIDINKLQNVAICPSAIDFLSNCGLYNHVIKNRYRFVRLH